MGRIVGTVYPETPDTEGTAAPPEADETADADKKQTKSSGRRRAAEKSDAE